MTLSLATDKYSLAYFDESANSWKLPEGTYQFMIGTSINDIKHTLSNKIEKAEYTVIAKFSK